MTSRYHIAFSFEAARIMFRPLMTCPKSLVEHNRHPGCLKYSGTLPNSMPVGRKKTVGRPAAAIAASMP